MITLREGTPNNLWWVGKELSCECGWAGKFEVQDQAARQFTRTGTHAYWICPHCEGNVEVSRAPEELKDEQ